MHLVFTDDLDIYITTGNAGDVCLAVKQSNKHYVRCFAHTINLAVQKRLESLKDPLLKIREHVKHVHYSTSVKIAFEVSPYLKFKFFQSLVHLCN